MSLSHKHGCDCKKCKLLVYKPIRSQYNCKPKHKHNCDCHECLYKHHDHDCDCGKCNNKHKKHDHNCNCNKCKHDDDCDCSKCRHEDNCECNKCKHKPHKHDCDCHECIIRKHDNDCDCRGCQFKHHNNDCDCDGCKTKHHKYNCDCYECKTRYHKLHCKCNECKIKFHKHDCTCYECKTKYHKMNCNCDICKTKIHKSDCDCYDCKGDHNVHNHGKHCKCHACKLKYEYKCDCNECKHKNNCECDCNECKHKHDCECDKCKYNKCNHGDNCGCDKCKHHDHCKCEKCIHNKCKHDDYCGCDECNHKHHKHDCNCNKCKSKHHKHDKHCGCDECGHKKHKHNCNCLDCKPNYCSDSESSCDDDYINKCHSCINRDYLNENNTIRCKLAKLQYQKTPCLPNFNTEEKKYKCHHYNAQFHKALTHNNVTGSLSHNIDYTNMVHAILHNEQILLAAIPLNPGAQMKLANPLASLSSVLIGAPTPVLHLVSPPTLCSMSGAADMVENYTMEYVRDVAFINYGVDANIALVLDSSHMNSPDVLANLLYKPPGSFSVKTLFRGPSSDELVGPYISQLLLLNIPFGGMIVPQKYNSYVNKSIAIGRIEWGINNTETIAMENALINTFPVANPLDKTITYINNGRALAEAVHNDTAYQLFYQAALILNKLGAVVNPTFPSYSNQGPFITCGGLPDILCSLATVTELSLKHAWYWKWQVYRKLRPEVFGLWIDNVKTGLVPNSHNYDINPLVLNNGIMADIHSIYNSYTLSQCYIEGSPTHPSYPAGHGLLGGACCTLLKVFFDANKSWNSLPGVIAGSLGPVGVVQADALGNNLVSYVDVDSSNMTIAGEIDKLASNVGLGRDWAGVHYRSDSEGGKLLGEKIAIKYMEDMLSSMVENNLNNTPPAITFRKFDGSMYTIKPTVCE